MCAQWSDLFSSQKCAVTPFIKTAHHHYFHCKVGDRDNPWVPHICRNPCAVNLIGQLSNKVDAFHHSHDMGKPTDQVVILQGAYPSAWNVEKEVTIQISCQLHDQYHTEITCPFPSHQTWSLKRGMERGRKHHPESTTRS